MENKILFEKIVNDFIVAMNNDKKENDNITKEEELEEKSQSLLENLEKEKEKALNNLDILKLQEINKKIDNFISNKS